MEEEKMIPGIIGIIIGLLIACIGIYYSVQSKKEDGKVFGFYKALTVIGVVLVAVFITVLVLTLVL